MFDLISLKTKRAALRLRSTGGLLFGEPFVSRDEKHRYRNLFSVAEDHGDHPMVEFHPTCLGGQSMLCRPGTRDRSSLQDLLFYQTYLPPQSLRNPKVIVDLGVNVGYTVSHFAFLYPDARIIGVELDAGNFLLAQRNTQWCNDRVTLMNAAIWSSNGSVSFDGRGEDAFHVVTSHAGSSRERDTQANRQARSITMDSVINEVEIPYIDYLKMDIEGAEEEIILRANPTWLERVGCMKVELHDCSYSEFSRALSASGFDCRPDSRHPHCIVATRRSG